MRSTSLGFDLTLFAFDAKNEKQRVEDEGTRDGSEGVHEKVQLWVAVSVALEPLEHFFFLNQVACKR